MSKYALDPGELEDAAAHADVYAAMAENRAAFNRKRRIMAARSEIRSMFPGDVVEAMVGVDGRVSFERRPPIDACEADLRLSNT